MTDPIPSKPGPAKPGPAKKAESDQAMMTRLVRISTIGTNFAFAVIGMGFIGWASQKWWLKSAAPWPLLIGLFVGLIGGFYRFVRDAMALANDDGKK